jgi:hypothetical protein
MLSTSCPKTAAEAPLEGSVPHPLVVAMMTEVVVTVAGAMKTGVTGIALAMTKEETMTVRVMMIGGTTIVLVMMIGGIRGLITMIALDYPPPTLLVYFR